MVGIVFATLREARPFLERITVQELRGRPFPLYRIATEKKTAGMIIVSSMGKVAAAMAGTYLALQQRLDVLVSAGLCGRVCADRALRVGDLFRITHAVEGDCDRFGKAEIPIPCAPQWFGKLPGARLITCDRPVFDPDLRDRLAAFGDLADMEGAAVARVAHGFGIACAMIKGISDTADGNGRQSVADNMERVSARIADALLEEFDQLANDRRL